MFYSESSGFYKYYRGMIEGFADLSEFHEYEEYCQLVNEVFPEE